jgi:hypothetical protein
VPLHQQRLDMRLLVLKFPLDNGINGLAIHQIM